jgi:ABC-type enterochelin transport system substrate-binding protein
MLAAQMAAVHVATMNAALRLARAETVEQRDSASTAFNKLARTFAAQMEALKRHRTTGEQIVRVHRVTVNEGGQAIVGNVAGGGVATKKIKSRHCHESAGPSVAPTGGTALLGHVEADAAKMPNSG